MRVDITSETSFWTDIEVTGTNGGRVFKGCLQLTQDGWELSTDDKGYMVMVERWMARRHYLSALAAAIEYIGKTYREE